MVMFSWVVPRLAPAKRATLLRTIYHQGQYAVWAPGGMEVVRCASLRGRGADRCERRITFTGEQPITVGVLSRVAPAVVSNRDVGATTATGRRFVLNG